MPAKRSRLPEGQAQIVARMAASHSVMTVEPQGTTMVDYVIDI